MIFFVVFTAAVLALMGMSYLIIMVQDSFASQKRRRHTQERSSHQQRDSFYNQEEEDWAR